jgi:hypothetical protein
MKNKILALLLLPAFLILAGVFSIAAVHASISFAVPTPSAGTYQNFQFFSATTTTATSTNITGGGGYFIVAGAKDVTLYFSRGDTHGVGNTGNTQFKVQVTPDGQNWFDYNELGAVTISSTGDQFYTRVGTSTISAATSTLMYAMEDIGFYAIRCIAVKTTDGESTCRASAVF